QRERRSPLSALLSTAPHLVETAGGRRRATDAAVAPRAMDLLRERGSRVRRISRFLRQSSGDRCLHQRTLNSTESLGSPDPPRGNERKYRSGGWFLCSSSTSWFSRPFSCS